MKTMPKTFDRLYLYYGCEALGFQDQGFAPPKTFRAKIGAATLKTLEDSPGLWAVLPYLRPLESVDSHHEDYRDALIHGNGAALHTPEQSIKQYITFHAEIVNTFRQLGYDCDNLIDQGLALIHPDFDAKSLF